MRVLPSALFCIAFLGSASTHPSSGPMGIDPRPHDDKRAKQHARSLTLRGRGRGEALCHA
ncbi:MAG: hypothetical protein ABI300_05940 [Rhodanobacter sp.]